MDGQRKPTAHSTPFSRRALQATRATRFCHPQKGFSDSINLHPVSGWLRNEHMWTHMAMPGPGGQQSTIQALILAAYPEAHRQCHLLRAASEHGPF